MPAPVAAAVQGAATGERLVVVGAVHTGRVGDEHGRLQVVGAGVTANLARAAAGFERLAAKSASNGGDLSAALAATIESTRSELEDCLRGFDSFDMLAFLRVAVGPWDFSDVRESETRVEGSQAAQDVVALTLLGMGLPRLPLTGKNSGQPDIGKAMRLAADIVVGAQVRGLFEGRQLARPLGALAGEFKAYELSVRGRQYESIATELNTGLLGDTRVAAILAGALKFTLDDVRAMRDAATGLLNERLFGARDRVGDLVQSGAGPGEVEADAFRRDINLMLNECRLFGAMSAADVAERAGLDTAQGTAVLKFFSTGRPGDGSANPVVRFVEGERPAPWGCLADGGEYLVLNGFLGEDELRRDIERGLAAAGRAAGSSKLWARYDRLRAALSEEKVAEALSGLLLGAKPRWAGQKYLGPVDVNETSALGRHADRTAVATREFESDVLFVVDGVALCVEVKAGSVTEKARRGNAQRLAADLDKTLKDGNEQADRLTRLIRAHGGVWNAAGEWIDLSDAVELHSVIVMLDDMGPLSLSMNDLACQGIIDSDDVPWIVSLHDLIVIGRTVDHPAQLIEYLRRRRSRRLATMVRGVDELDMFMWFVNGGMYFEPNPRDNAAQLPIDRPVTPADIRRYDAQGRVRLSTLTDPLDAWFYSHDGLSDAEVPKPVRPEQPWVEQYLTTSESDKTPGWLRFGADLVGLSEQAQRKIEKGLQGQRRRTRGGTVERSLTTHATSAHGSWLLTLSVVPEGARTDHLPEYMDAKQYQTASTRSMLLLYDPDGALKDTRYRGQPQRRTAERDAALELAPLLSLADTFTVVPPGARRNKKQLRGKRSSRRRR